MPALPSGFWGCLLGLVACGGTGLFVLAMLLRRSRAARMRRLVRGEEGTTIVEFPFAMLVLVLMTVLTWQLGFLVSAYLVVDYAAFAAVRSAIVQIPPAVSDEEGAHTVQDVSLDHGEKGEEIKEAAAFVCYAISARYTETDAWAAEVPLIQQIVSIPGADVLKDGLDTFDFATRYVYALRNTGARLVVAGKESGEHTYGSGQTVTVEVTHDFSLRIAIAARIFGTHRFPEGYVTPVTASATMLFEGATELVPPDAPDGAQP